MNDLAKKIINENITFLKDDLQGDVIQYCSNLLSDCNVKEINKQTSEEEKVRTFLDIMSTKPLADLDYFIDSLKTHYFWLYEALKETRVSIKTSETLKTQLLLGGVPNLPHRNVTRKKLVGQIRDGLKTLHRGQYLVLHGMVGCGKTTLASEALHDLDLIIDHFDGRVYWLTVGSEGSEDLASLQAELNLKLPLPEPSFSTCTELALIQLTKRFVYEVGLNSLIILDDVTTGKVLDCLNVGAKFLVTTKNEAVIGNRDAKFIKIDEGFSKNETLEMFAKCLQIKPHALPTQAEEIHIYTKGFPMTVSLIAARLEEFKDDVTLRWKYYENLYKNKISRRRSLGDAETLMNAIGDAICNGLNPKQKTNFEFFSIFIEDVNIKPEVLGTLWSLNKYQAEEEMMDFVKKSLVVRKWNKLQESYVYGVHDQILYYLKNNLSDKLQEFHRTLLNRYKETCKGDWSKLPSTDNYIYYYIGYHLEKAGMTHLFPELYFNLEFIEAKLKVTGPADVLRDFKKYHKYITNNEVEELVGKAKIITSLVEYYGSMLSKEVDIVQAVLQEPKTCPLYEEGVKLARKRSRKYISFPRGLPQKSFTPQTFNCKTKEITAVCFGGSNMQYVIVSSGNSGDLKMYNTKSKWLKTNFRGHKGKINSLKISPCKKFFLSTSMDNTAMMWSLDPNRSSSGERTPSPREIQADYIDFFLEDRERGGERPISILEHEEAVISSSFSPAGDMVATLTLTHVILWSLDTWNAQWKTKVPQGTRSIDIMSDQREGVVTVVGGDAGVMVFDITTVHARLIDKSPVLCLFPLSDYQGGGLVLVNRSSVEVRRDLPSPHMVRVLPDSSSPITMASVSSYIAIGRADNSVSVYNLQNGSLVTTIPSVQRKLMGVHVNDTALLAGYSDGTLLVYPLEGSTKPLSRVRISPDSLYIARLVSKRTVQVREGREELWKVEREAVLADLSQDGRTLAVCSPEGELVLVRDQGASLQTLLSTAVLPSAIFILGQTHSLTIAVTFAHAPVLIFKEEGAEQIKLGRETIGCDFVELVQYGPRALILTISPSHPAPLQFWELNGEKVEGKLPRSSSDFITCYTTAGSLVALAYNTHLSTLDLAKEENVLSKTWRDIVNASLVSISPSHRYLAVLHTGVVSLLEMDKEGGEKRTNHKWNVDMEEKLLAVSDNGTICLGGSGLVVLIAPDGTRSVPAFIDAVMAEAHPLHTHQFHLVDSSGLINVITLDSLF